MEKGSNLDQNSKPLSINGSLIELCDTIKFIETQVTGLHHNMASIRNDLDDRRTIQLSMAKTISDMKNNIQHEVRHEARQNMQWSHVYKCRPHLIGHQMVYGVLGRYTTINRTIDRAIADGVDIHDVLAIQRWLYDIARSHVVVVTHKSLVAVSDIMSLVYTLNYN
jgi:hypothetical protein